MSLYEVTQLLTAFKLQNEKKNINYFGSSILFLVGEELKNGNIWYQFDVK